MNLYNALVWTLSHIVSTYSSKQPSEVNKIFIDEALAVQRYWENFTKAVCGRLFKCSWNPSAGSVQKWKSRGKYVSFWWHPSGTWEVEGARESRWLPSPLLFPMTQSTTSGGFSVSVRGRVSTSTWGSSVLPHKEFLAKFYVFTYCITGPQLDLVCLFQNLRQDVHSCILDFPHSHSHRTVNMFINISVESSYYYHNCQRHGPGLTSSVGNGRIQEN